jgi:hypothetical protein
MAGQSCTAFSNCCMASSLRPQKSRDLPRPNNISDRNSFSIFGNLVAIFGASFVGDDVEERKGEVGGWSASAAWYWDTEVSYSPNWKSADPKVI